MAGFITQRFLTSILTLFMVLVIVFGLARVTGDPRDVFMPIEATEEERERIAIAWGLDKPLYHQLFQFLINISRGDFGESWRWPGQNPLFLTLSRLGASLQLAFSAMLFTVIVAVPIGVVGAVYKGTWVDTITKTIALIGQSVPHFLMGVFFSWIFGIQLGWLPTSGRGTLLHLIMPTIVIGWFQVAALMRLVRSSMLEVLDSEYIKLARIKGLSENRVIWKHAFRNALIPPLTYFGLMVGLFLVGSITTEIVFSWPGTGRLAVDAIRARDFHVVQTVALVFGFIFILINFVVDIMYAYLDPRIRYN